MDTNVAGLNKVYCFTTDSNNNGKTVSITDGTNTWLKVIDSLSCVFMIPSMPAPAKRSYTVTLHNGDETQSALYTRTIELGFGDSVRIGLYENDEPITKGSIPKATDTRIGGMKANSTNSSRGVKMDGDWLQLQAASSSLLGGVQVSDTTSNGLYMSGNSLMLRSASASQKGGVKVGTGLSVVSDVLNLRELTRTSASCTKVSSASAVGAQSYASIEYSIPSTDANLLKRGFAEGTTASIPMSPGDYPVIFTIERIASGQYVDVMIINLNNHSVTIPSTISLYYAYF